MTEPQAAPASAADKIDPQLKRLAIAIVVGAITVILDTTIVSVGLHELAQSLNADITTIQWVSTAYLLAMFVTIPLTGWAQGRIGSKALWLTGLSVFLLGSTLCALAWSPGSLIAFRAIQGLGGGVMMPLMATILMQAAGGKNVGRLMATVSLPVALGPILGPVIGGIIIHSLSWHWMFLINLPIGIVGLILAVRAMPRGDHGKRVRLDTVGLLLLTPGILGLIYGLTQAGAKGGFGHPTVLIPLIGGALLVAGFAVWALRRGERALIDIKLFNHRPLAVSSLLMFLSGFALYGSMLLLPLYWQQVRGEDALGAGLLLIPQGVGALASRTLAGRLTDTIGARWVAVVGFSIMAVATLPFAFASESTPMWLLMVVLFVRGFGLGGVFIPLMAVAYEGLDRDEIPDASIITRVAQQVGGSFGVAILAAILASAAIGAETPADLARAFDAAFWWAVGFSALAALTALLVPKRPTSRASQPAPALNRAN